MVPLMYTGYGLLGVAVNQNRHSAEECQVHCFRGSYRHACDPRDV